MKTYIAPEVEICMFDVEDVITTSANNTLEVLGIKTAEIKFSDLNTDMSGEVDLLK